MASKRGDGGGGKCVGWSPETKMSFFLTILKATPQTSGDSLGQIF